MNYQVTEESARGTDAIGPEHYHHFSGPNTTPLLHACDIFTETNWLEMVDLARAEYEASYTDGIRQAKAQRTIMHVFLITNGPFVTPPSHANQKAYQGTEITTEEEQLSSANFFGNSITFVVKRSTQTIHHHDYFQQTPLCVFF